MQREPNVRPAAGMHASDNRKPPSQADRGVPGRALNGIDMIAVDLPSPNVGGSCQRRGLLAYTVRHSLATGSHNHKKALRPVFASKVSAVVFER